VRGIEGAVRGEISMGLTNVNNKRGREKNIAEGRK